MRVHVTAAPQAHALPPRAYEPRGLFASSVTSQAPVVFDDEFPNDGGNFVPPGSTAQNDFQEVRWYRCNTCGDVLRETHVDGHVCEETEE